jgi:hypothetical protein
MPIMSLWVAICAHHAHSAYAELFGQLDSSLHGRFTDHIAQAIITIQHLQRQATAHCFYGRARIYGARVQPLDVNRRTEDTVGINAPQVRLHHRIGGVSGIIAAHAGPLK